MLKKIIKKLLQSQNLHLIHSNTLSRYIEIEKDFDFLLNLPSDFINKLLPLIPHSQSQLKQDLFVVSETNFKKNGYFIEFGATNGKLLSNTYLLEKELNWNGILAEPARCWHEDLNKNRNCIKETKCVWQKSGEELTFNEVNAPELSTIEAFNNSDNHAVSRKSGKQYKVETISLLDLLIKHNAPKNIDYLSIDTEGSEYDILNEFDFNAYNIKIITCEHNFTPMREKIEKLLYSKGYTKKHTGLSKWDDWYVRN